MPRVTTLFSTGALGSRVAVVQRGTSLFLRYTVDRRHTFVPVKHTDVVRAKEQARDLTRALVNARAAESGAPGAHRGLTVTALFARYAEAVSAHKKGAQPAEDGRRRLLWTAFLGAERKATSVTPADVERYIALRRSGQVLIPGVALRARVKPRTIDADVVWLQSVYNWAERAKLVQGQPLKGARRPDVPTQLRPMAGADRATDLLHIAEWVHPRFALFFTAVRTLGWRVTAVCKLDGADVRLTAAPHAPYGEIRKNWEHDKEGVEAWLPLPRALRDALLDAHVPSHGPLFPSPKDATQPWSRFYARALLEKAEDVAGLEPIAGGDWHPYRRLWATERKGLPLPDVAGAGGWADQRTVQKYQQKDPETTAAVMLFTAPKPRRAPTAARTNARTTSTRTTPRKERHRE